MANIVITYVAGKIIEFEYNALYKNGVLQEIQDIHEFHLFLIEKTEGDPKRGRLSSRHVFQCC